MEQKKRAKARKAAQKEKPLFEEDGTKRGLLDKYDEEEDAGMDIDEKGVIDDEKARKQAEIKAKLAAGEATLSILLYRVLCCITLSPSMEQLLGPLFASTSAASTLKWCRKRQAVLLAAEMQQDAASQAFWLPVQFLFSLSCTLGLSRDGYGK